MIPNLRGRAAYIFSEDHFDVDRILGFEAMRAHDAAAMRASAMQAFDPDFQRTVMPGDLLIGGRNFGYGHPHGPPMETMRSLGVAGVIAESFAPLYLMGEISAGFPQITCPGILEATQRWDQLAVDWVAATIVNLRTGQSMAMLSPTVHERRMIEAGGLFALLRAYETTQTP